jgi:hypothetical protein
MVAQNFGRRRLVAGLRRVEFAGTIGLDWRRALTRASEETIESTRGPAATSRRRERRVAFPDHAGG